MLDYALVNAFVPTADQYHPRVFIREATGFGLIEHPPLRREQNYARALPLFARLLLGQRFRQDGFNGAKDRFGFQHHPVAAAERAIINYVVFIKCKRTQVVNDNLDDPLLPRAFGNPEIERPREKFRKDSQQVETHNICHLSLAISHLSFAESLDQMSNDKWPVTNDKLQIQ